MSLDIEIERVSNLWNDFVEINGIESIKSRKENINDEINKTIKLIENSEMTESEKRLNHAKLLTGMILGKLI